MAKFTKTQEPFCQVFTRSASPNTSSFVDRYSCLESAIDDLILEQRQQLEGRNGVCCTPAGRICVGGDMQHCSHRPLLFWWFDLLLTCLLKESVNPTAGGGSALFS